MITLSSGLHHFSDTKLDRLSMETQAQCSTQLQFIRTLMKENGVQLQHPLLKILSFLTLTSNVALNPILKLAFSASFANTF